MDESAATVRTWLVERGYDDRGLITLVYATPNGDRQFRTEQSAMTIQHNAGSITAARDVSANRLEPVDDAERRERFATEATRMAAEHDPDETV